MNLRNPLRLAFLAVLAITADAAATDAGSVLFATGPVTAERQPPEPLAKGDTVLVSDTVVTGAAARAQLLMLDGAKIAIRPNSRLRIDEFVYSGPSPAPGQAVISSSDERSVSSLLKGGFRTITGAIGKENAASYEVRTPVGVLGIRGTDYTAVFCNGDCSWVPGANANPIEDGLYLAVTAGIIVFSNEVGEIELRAGEFAFIPLSDRRARKLTTPPPVLLDLNDLADASGSGAATRPDDDGSAQGFDSALGTRRSAAPSSAYDPESADDETGREPPSQSVIGVDPDGTPVDITPGETAPQRDRTMSFSTGPLDAQIPFYSASAINTPSQYQLDVDNNLLRFEAPFVSRTGITTATLGIGSASNVDTGFDSMTVLRWGRWSGGTANITLADGTDASIDLSSQSLHWISGPELTAAPAIPVTGTASYSLLGNTSPTDNLGNVGVLGNAAFVANFTDQSVASTLSLDINNANWMASGAGGIGAMADPVLPAHLFTGFYNSVVIDGIAGGNGVFSGFFSEPGNTSDPGFPGGVGLTYSLQDQLGTTQVSGALVFGNP